MRGRAVVHAPEPRHGLVSLIRHTETELFAGILSPFSAARYHSLAVTDLPAYLETTAWSEDGVIHALQHRTRPQWGVQFHPESIASEEARTLLRNFAGLTVAWNRRDQKNDLPTSEDWVGKDAASDVDVPAGTSAELDLSRATIGLPSPRHHYILDTDEFAQLDSDGQVFVELSGDEPRRYRSTGTFQTTIRPGSRSWAPRREL